MKRLIIHIGITKTGTTAIQHTLSQHYQQLLELGVLYPVSGRTKHAHYNLSVSLGFNNRDKTKELTTSETLKLHKSLLKEIKNTPCEQVILSSEHFFRINSIDLIAEFFADFEVKIVIYLRRHDSWWESNYGQAVVMTKSPPWSSGFENYLAYQRKNQFKDDYKRLLHRWARFFGKENIIVRPFEVCQNQPNLVVDFFDAAGLSHIPKKIDLSPKHINQSLSFFSLSLIDTYQRVDVLPEARKILINHAKSISTNTPRTRISPPALRRQLIDENSQDYEYIAKEYLGRADGRLFYDPLPSPEDNWEEPKSPTSIEIVENTIQAMQEAHFKLGFMNLYKQWRS